LGTVINPWSDHPTLGRETSLTLLARAQAGDAVALEALIARYLTRLQRWAAGRVPPSARVLLDTDDVVQDALMNTLRRLEHFRPQHDGALLAYLREAVANRIRKELRRFAPSVDDSIDLDMLPKAEPSPLDLLVRREAIERYERALAQLDDDDRAAIIGRFEMGYSYDTLARAIGRPSPDAARTSGGADEAEWEPRWTAATLPRSRRCPTARALRRLNLEMYARRQARASLRQKINSRSACPVLSARGFIGVQSSSRT
jgi:RNA polymerase sigma-70 factor (ECF subfamily)